MFVPLFERTFAGKDDLDTFCVFGLLDGFDNKVLALFAREATDHGDGDSAVGCDRFVGVGEEEGVVDAIRNSVDVAGIAVGEELLLHKGTWAVNMGNRIVYPVAPHGVQEVDDGFALAKADCAKEIFGLDMEGAGDDFVLFLADLKGAVSKHKRHHAVDEICPVDGLTNNR